MRVYMRVYGADIVVNISARADRPYSEREGRTVFMSRADL